MSKKRKPAQDVAAGQAEEIPLAVSDAPIVAAAPEPGFVWPPQFRIQRQAALAGALFLALALLIFALANQNELLWVKRILAVCARLDAPLLPLGASSWDAGAVLVAFTLFLFAAWIHPVLGLFVLLQFRSPLDGYTWPVENLYFIVGICLTGLMYAIRSRKVETRILLTRSTIPLALFCVVVLFGFGTINYADSFRGKLLWVSYLYLFLITLNLARERRHGHWLIGALVLALAWQAIYSFLHFHYLLPYLRNALATNPQMRMAFFGTDAFTPELIRRFNVNRAFGSMLFPNALAGFLILLLPLSAATAWATIQRVGTLRNLPPVGAPHRPAAGLALAVWFFFLLHLFLAAEFRLAYDLTGVSWYENDLWLLLWSALLALVPAVAVFQLTLQRGAAYGLSALGAVLLPLLVLLEVYTLWVTYSRGAMLALVLASAFGGALLILRRGSRSAPTLQHWASRLAVLCVAVALLALACTALSQPAAFAQQTGAAAPASAAPIENQKLLVEGVNVAGQDLMNPATFRLRLSYWAVGWRMFLDHFWTGVGLNNFGAAYPIYQDLGAGETREAHNAILQMFSETGVFGGLLFCIFWAMVLLWGAARVLTARCRLQLTLLLGLYTGLLAFLIHASMDIHFSHPSLVMFAFTVTGLMYAVGEGGKVLKTYVPSRRVHLALLIAALGLLFGLTLPGLRPYIQAAGLSRGSMINMNSDADMKQRMQMANLFLVQIPDHASSPEASKPVTVSFTSALQLIPDAEKLKTLGNVFVPLEGKQGYRKLNAEEEVPQDAVLSIVRPWVAFSLALEYAESRGHELERIDAIFPHDPELALNISQWYELMLRRSINKKYAPLRERIVPLMIAWGERAVERNPLRAETHAVLAHTLWQAAQADLGPRRMDRIKRSLEEYARAAELSPLIPYYLNQYAQVLEQLANTPSKALTEVQKATYRQQAVEVLEKANALQQARWEHGLDQG